MKGLGSLPMIEYICTVQDTGYGSVEMFRVVLHSSRMHQE